jgi:hypothetical protein
LNLNKSLTILKDKGRRNGEINMPRPEILRRDLKSQPILFKRGAVEGKVVSWRHASGFGLGVRKKFDTVLKIPMDGGCYNVFVTITADSEDKARQAAHSTMILLSKMKATDFLKKFDKRSAKHSKIAAIQAIAKKFFNKEGAPDYFSETPYVLHVDWTTSSDGAKIRFSSNRLTEFDDEDLSFEIASEDLRKAKTNFYLSVPPEESEHSSFIEAKCAEIDKTIGKYGEKLREVEKYELYLEQLEEKRAKISERLQAAKAAGNTEQATVLENAIKSIDDTIQKITENHSEYYSEGKIGKLISIFTNFLGIRTLVRHIREKKGKKRHSVLAWFNRDDLKEAIRASTTTLAELKDGLTNGQLSELYREELFRLEELTRQKMETEQALSTCDDPSRRATLLDAIRGFEHRTSLIRTTLTQYEEELLKSVETLKLLEDDLEKHISKQIALLGELPAELRPSAMGERPPTPPATTRTTAAATRAMPPAPPLMRTPPTVPGVPPRTATGLTPEEAARESAYARHEMSAPMV